MSEPEYVRALDRGLAVLQAFSARTPVLTVAEVAAATNLTRATARRLLFTLEKLEFVSANGRGYSLTPKMLALGYAYLSSAGVGPIATPRVQALSAEIREAVTVGTLSGSEYVAVARAAQPDRILTAGLAVGTTRPAHASSIGKVLLAQKSPAELDEWFAASTRTRYTARTITDEALLRKELAEVRERGWATSDQELEEGLLSVGVPIHRGDRVVAAMNTTSHVGRTTLEDMIRDVLPRLLVVSAAISDDLAHTMA
ncbi:MAG TPA: IclR family transcriptional regulator C-terminal domain-containing protein [Pseudonocardia sp.]